MKLALLFSKYRSLQEKRRILYISTFNDRFFYFSIYGFFGSLFHLAPFIPVQKSYYIPNLALLKPFLKGLSKKVDGVMRLSYITLQLVGIGYKAFTPRKLSFSTLILKLGFGGTSLAFKLPNNIRLRARKQKLLLVGLDGTSVSDIAKKIIDFRSPVVYTGKGIRYRGQQIALKKRKQQQRGR